MNLCDFVSSGNHVVGLDVEYIWVVYICFLILFEIWARIGLAKYIIC